MDTKIDKYYFESKHYLKGKKIVENGLKNKIFERFYTDREVNQDKHSGLGLSIAKKIIESFSGSLKLNNVKSEKYFGACFSIILPLID